MSQIGFRYVWLFLLFSFAFALEVDVKSDFLERESSGRIYAYGNAVVSVKNYVINADILLYDTKLKELYAFGNLKVRSEDGKLELEGQEAFFDILRDEGFFTFVNGRVERLYITASFVKKVQNEYDISEASLTTCPPDKKELILCVSSAKIGERYAYGGSSTLRFFGLSVFYLPGFILPIGERRSGLLPPEIGSDSDSELIYKQGIYIVFDQNKDATIGFDVRSSGIKGLNFEYRQAIKKSNDFSFNIWVFKEPDFRTYRDERLQNRYRFKLSLDLENLKLKIDKVSDRYFLQDYAKKDDRTAPYLESFVSFSKYIGDAIVYSDFRYFYDTTSESNSLTLQRLPEVGVYLPSRLVFKDTYFSFRSSFTNFYGEKGKRAQRLLLSPVLSYQKNFGDRLTSITDIRFDGIYYLNSSNLVSSLAFSQTLRTFLKQDIYGTEFNAGFGTRYRHRSIEGKTLGFDVFDRIGYENDIDFTLDLKAFRNGEQKLSAIISKTGRVGGNFTPFKGVIEVSPFSWALFSFEKTHDEKNQEGSFSLLRLFSKGAEIKLSHGVVREKNSRVGEQLGVGLGFSSERLYLEANLMRDVFANRDTLKSLQATYKGGCWEFGAFFRESVEGARHIREAFLTLSVFDFRGLKLPISR